MQLQRLESLLAKVDSARAGLDEMEHITYQGLGFARPAKIILPPTVADIAESWGDLIEEDFFLVSEAAAALILTVNALPEALEELGIDPERTVEVLKRLVRERLDACRWTGERTDEGG